MNEVTIARIEGARLSTVISRTRRTSWPVTRAAVAEVDVQALSGGRAGRQWASRRFRIGNATPRAARRLAVIESCWRACAALERRAAADDRRLRCALLALVDEAGIVAEHLREGQARVACQLRAAGAHRRAGAAYRRAGRL